MKRIPDYKSFLYFDPCKLTYFIRALYIKKKLAKIAKALAAIVIPQNHAV